MENKKTQISKDLIIVGILIPIAYILLSLTPWSKDLFIEKNREYFSIFWLSIIIMHWLTFIYVWKRIKSRNHSFSEYGYKISTINSVYLIIIYFLIASGLLVFIELNLDYGNLSEEKINQIPMFFPTTLSERIIFVFAVLTAAICEETIYRGFLIESFKQIGINKWLAICLSAISFVFIHGIVGYYKFPFYFFPALIFGVIYVLSKKLMPNIIIHLFFDLIGIFAIYQALR